MTYSDEQNEKPLITHSSYDPDDRNRNTFQRSLIWLRKRNTLVVRIIGIIGALATAYFLVSGITCLVQNSMQKDEEGYSPTWKWRIEKSSSAIIFPSDGNWVPVNNVGSLKIHVTANDPVGEVFVGVADAEAVETYLGETDYFTLEKLLILPDRAKYLENDGTVVPGLPGDQTFWRLLSSGTGTQEVIWRPHSGSTLVIMNGDGSTMIDTKVTLWTVTAYKFMTGMGMLTAAFILGLLSSFIIMSTRKAGNTVYPVPKMMLPKR